MTTMLIYSTFYSLYYLIYSHYFYAIVFWGALMRADPPMLL